MSLIWRQCRAFVWAFLDGTYPSFTLGVFSTVPWSLWIKHTNVCQFLVHLHKSKLFMNSLARIDMFACSHPTVECRVRISLCLTNKFFLSHYTICKMEKSQLTILIYFCDSFYVLFIFESYVTWISLCIMISMKMCKIHLFVNICIVICYCS